MKTKTMNTLNLAWHLFRKDVHYHRLALLSLWLLVLLIPGKTLLKPTGNVDLLDALLMGGFYAAIFLTLCGLLQMDPPARDLHFLATRPVPWFSLWLGKFAFIGIFFFGSVLAAKLLTVWAVGLAYDSEHLLSCMGETGSEIAALLSLVILFALFSRKTVTVFYCLLIFCIISIFFLGLLQADHIISVAIRAIDGSAESFDFLWFISGSVQSARWRLLFVLLLVIVSMVRYRNKAYRLPIIVFLIGLICIPPNWAAMSFDNSSNYYDDPKLAFNESEVHQGGEASHLTVNWPAPDHCDISCAITADLKAPYFASGSETECQFVLPGTPVSHIKVSSVEDDYTPPLNLERRMVEIPNRHFEPVYPDSVKLVTIPLSELGGASRIESLQGTVALYVHKTFLLPDRLPLTEGATFTYNNCRYAIEDIIAVDRTIALRFIRQSAPPGFFYFGGVRTTIFIYNSYTGESMIPYGETNSMFMFSNGQFLSSSSDDFEFRLNRVPLPTDPPLDIHEWVKHAKVVIFETSSSAYTDRINFNFNNLDLHAPKK